MGFYHALAVLSLFALCPLGAGAQAAKTESAEARSAKLQSAKEQNEKLSASSTASVSAAAGAAPPPGGHPRAAAPPPDGRHRAAASGLAAAKAKKAASASASKSANSQVLPAAGSEASLFDGAEGVRGLAQSAWGAAQISTSLEGGLEYPLGFGIYGKYHFNPSFYTRLGAGFASKLWLGGFEKIASAIGVLSEAQARLMSDVIANSLMGSWRAGWLPYTKKTGGPYIELGLAGFMWGGQEIDPIWLERGLKGIEIEDSLKGGASYSADTRLIAGSFHIGYQIPLAENMRLNMEAGAFKILSSQFLDQESESSVPLSSAQKTALKKFLRSKTGWIAPTFSCWLGFSF